MPSTRNKLEIIVEASAKKAAEEIASFSRQAGGQLKRMAAESGSALGKISRRVFSLKGALVGLVGGYGLTKLADGFLDVGSSAEQMQISLDTLTKGHGLEWFEKLNAWALKMPVNTEKAVQSFIMMRAMGLEPTIEDMTTLVDTTSALGGGAGTLEGIARALGQIKTKGKVSAEELMQLAERGVPAYEILREKLGLTGEQLSNIGAQGIDASRAIHALLEGMAEKFGGQSAKIQDKWAGLTESLKSYWKEFQRLVMRSGVMKALEVALGTLIKRLDELKKKGKLDEWGKKIGENMVNIIADVVMAIGWMPTAFFSVNEAIHKTLSFIAALGSAAIDVSAFVAATINPYWAAKLAWKGTVQGKDLGTALRELFPTLAEYKDRLDKIGQGQYEAAVDAKRSAKEFAQFGLELEGIAGEIRNIKIEPPKPETAPEPPKPPTSPKPDIPTIAPGALKAQESLRAQLTERIKSLTLSEYEYKKWALEQEVVELQKKAGKDRALLDQVTEYHKLQLNKLKEEHAKAEKDKYRKYRKDTREYLEWHLKQMEEHGATIRELEREKWDWEKRYTEDAFKGLKIGWLEYLDDVKTVTQRMADLSKTTAQSMERSFSDFFFDAMTGKLKSFGDYVTSFLNSVARALSNLMAQQVVSGAGDWFKGIFSPSTSAAVAHSGGIIGRTALPARMVPSSLFAAAPRLHTGLAPDEYPAILQRGEAVIPREQVRRGPQSPNVTVNIINQGREEKKAEVSNVRLDLRQWVIDVVLSDINENGPLRHALGAGAI